MNLTSDDMKRIGRICGWAPGNYMGKCADCGGEITGDKLSAQCFVCAVVNLKKNAETATMTERERCIGIVNKAAWAASSEAIIARMKSEQL